MSEPRIEALGGGAWRLAGRIDLQNAETWLRAGEAAWAGEAEVELEVGGLDGSGSAGLAVLLEWALAARRAGRRLRCRALPAGLAEVARLGGVEGLLVGDAG